MTQPEIRYARNGSVHIAFETLGSDSRSGLDVLRIASYVSNLEVAHGLPALEAQTARLAALGRVISYDNRGTGLSDRVSDARLPSLEERVDDLRAVLDAAGSERAVLACFADGGPLGCMFAATHPERTIALVLCNTRPRIAWAPDYPWGIRRDDYERWLEETESRWGTVEYAKDEVRDAPFAGVPFEEQVRWELAFMRASAGPGDAVRATRMHYDSDARGVLGTIRVPTLVLSRGGVLGDEGKAFADRIPGARHIVVPGTSPIVMGEHPELFVAELKRFVEEVRDEEAELESVLATVLFTDIVGSTERQSALGDRRWAEVVAAHHRVVRGCLARYRGRELDTAGDGFFAAFDGPARAIRCARSVVDQVRELDLEVRAGLHTGECRTVDGKPGGLAVSIGARVTALAGPSEVLVSQTVKDLIAGSGLSLDDRGEHELKGVPGPWRVYAVA